MTNTRIFRTPFSSIYPLYIQKAERKGRTRAEVDAVIFWLTGYNKKTLQQQIDKRCDFEPKSCNSTICPTGRRR